MKLAEGKTVKDFRRLINKLKRGEETPPPVDFRHFVSSGVVSPGERMAMRIKLPRGKYVMVCFWPDAAMGGMPHAFMGMYRGITLR